MWRWHYRSLTVRVTATMVVMIGWLLAVAAAAQLELQSRYAAETARLHGRALSETVYGAIHNAMLANDRASLTEMVRAIGERSPEVQVRVYDADGRIGPSSSPAETGTKPRGADAWHGNPRALAALPESERAHFFELNGVQTLGVIRPIENERACSTASCHAHPARDRVLGSLAVEISMASAEEHLSRTRSMMIGVAMGTLVIITAVVLLLMRSAVHQPIRELVDTLDRLASGDYSTRYRGKARGELGFVGAAVNRMAHELEGANAELLRWAQTLERRVDEKTAELKVAQERVLRIERMASLGKLAAIVAHEINNPLASVVTYSRLLLRRRASGGLGQDPETHAILDAIASESARCGDIVTNLLAFARTRGTKPRPTKLREVVDRVAFLLKHKMDLAQVTFTAEIAPDLPEVVLDPAQLEQALLALAVNAIDAMPGGGGLVVRGDAPREGALRIEVEDSGGGIPPDVLPHIFEPFYSAQGDEAKGLGIGLAVVDSIVENNHGTIEVDSAVGRGTRFRMTFPLTPPAPAPAPPSEPPSPRTEEVHP